MDLILLNIFIINQEFLKVEIHLTFKEIVTSTSSVGRLPSGSLSLTTMMQPDLCTVTCHLNPFSRIA